MFKLKIFDRYLGQQVLFTITAATVVLSVVLVLANLFKKLIGVLAQHPELGWGFVLEFAANVLPFSLIFTIPWAFLTSVLLIFGRLSADNELTALRMSGLSMTRICAPVFAVSLLMTCVTFWMNVEVSPKSQAKVAQIFFELATENPGAMFIEDEVVNTLPGYALYTTERTLIDEESGQYLMKNLQLVKLTNRKRPEMFVQADEAIIGFEPGNNDDLYLELTDAHLEKAEGINADDFIRAQMVQPGEAMLQLSLAELKEKHRKERPSFMTVAELSREIRAAIGDPVYQSTLRTEMHKRFSLSLACITFTFIGISLGVTAQRRETTVGFALSLIIAIAYFLFIVIAEMFHKNPEAYPHLLMWTPNVIFLGLGLLLFWRLSRR